MPLDDSTIKDLKIRRQQVIRAEQILVELLVYVAFLFTLYVISYSNRDVKWYTSNLHLRQHLVDQQQNGINKITGTQKFDNVSSNNIKGTPKAYTVSTNIIALTLKFNFLSSQIITKIPKFNLVCYHHLLFCIIGTPKFVT